MQYPASSGIRTLVAVVTVGIIASAAGGLVVLAAVEDVPQIYACVKTNGGSVRIVDGPGNCRASETGVSWNQQGVAGPSGPAGPAGPQGPAGEPGGGGITAPDPQFRLQWSCSECDLQDVSFTAQIMGRASIWLSNVGGADFSYAELIGAHFEDTNGVGANFAFADMRRASLFKVDFSNSDFTNTNLELARFDNANLQGSIGVPSSLTDTWWWKVTCPDGYETQGRESCEGHFLPS